MGVKLAKGLMTGYSGMSETAVCQRRRHVRDCGMSETAARQWWSLEWRVGAAGDVINVAVGATFPAKSVRTVVQHRTAGDTLEKLPTAEDIAEEHALVCGVTRY